MSSVVSKAGTQGLLVREESRASQRPSQEAASVAQESAAELGYRAGAERALTAVVYQALRKVGAPTPFTPESVKRYREYMKRRNMLSTLLKGAANLFLCVALFNPVSSSIRIARSVGDFIGGCLGLSVLWSIPFVFLATFGFLAKVEILGVTGVLYFALFQFATSFVFSRLAEEASDRLTLEDGDKGSFLRLESRTWRTRPLIGYRSHVPTRVLQNALAIKRELRALGLTVVFEVEEFADVPREEAEQRRLEEAAKRASGGAAEKVRTVQQEWFLDPFLIMTVRDKKKGTRLPPMYLDYWDEEEFVPERIMPF